MKKILFILLLLPFISFSQKIGVKAGLISKGYNTGIIFEQPFSEKETAFFNAELLYCGTKTIVGYDHDRHGAQDKTKPFYEYRGSLQLPLYIKSTLSSKLSPIFSAGFMPEYVYSLGEMNPNLLFGTGLTYGRLTLDIRYILEISEGRKDRVNAFLSFIVFKKSE